MLSSATRQVPNAHVIRENTETQSAVDHGSPDKTSFDFEQNGDTVAGPLAYRDALYA